jgi:hypothetical protein
MVSCHHIPSISAKNIFVLLVKSPRIQPLLAIFFGESKSRPHCDITVTMVDHVNVPQLADPPT